MSVLFKQKKIKLRNKRTFLKNKGEIVGPFRKCSKCSRYIKYIKLVSRAVLLRAFAFGQAGF